MLRGLHQEINILIDEMHPYVISWKVGQGECQAEEEGIRSGDGTSAETIKNMVTGMKSIKVGPLMDEMVFEERKAMGSHGRVLGTRTAQTPLQENASGDAGKEEWEKGETTVPFRGKRKMSFSETKLLHHKNCFNFIPQWALKRQQRHNCSQVNRNENVMLDPTASWCCKL